MSSVVRLPTPSMAEARLPPRREVERRHEAQRIGHDRLVRVVGQCGDLPERSRHAGDAAAAVEGVARSVAQRIDPADEPI